MKALLLFAAPSNPLIFSSATLPFQPPKPLLTFCTHTRSVTNFTPSLSLKLKERRDWIVRADEVDAESGDPDDYDFEAEEEADEVDNKKDYDVEYGLLLSSPSATATATTDDIEMVDSKTFVFTQGWDPEMVVDYRINEDEFHKISLLDCDFFIRKPPDPDNNVYDFREMYVTPPDTDIYAIPKVLAPMPQKAVDSSKCNNMIIDIAFDYNAEFTTHEIFKSKDAMVQWTREVGMRNEIVVVIKSSVAGTLTKKPRYIRCSKSDYGLYNVTEPPIDAPRDPLYKTDREILKVFLTKHYRNRRTDDREFVLDFEEIYVIDSKTKSITRAKVLVTVTGGRNRDRKSDLLIIRDNGTSFKIIHTTERDDPTTIIEREEWIKTRKEMESYLRKFRDFDVSNWF